MCGPQLPRPSNIRQKSASNFTSLFFNSQNHAEGNEAARSTTHIHLTFSPSMITILYLSALSDLPNFPRDAVIGPAYDMLLYLLRKEWSFPSVECEKRGHHENSVRLLLRNPPLWLPGQPIDPQDRRPRSLD